MLVIHRLSKHFAGVKAVDQVDFSMESGEIRAMIGPNGAGKTTFVNLVSGQQSPSSGSIEFLHQDIRTWPAYKRVRSGIAYTFQITNIYGNLSVGENVEIALQNVQPNYRQQDIHHLLKQTSLHHVMQKRGHELAYGHQRLLEVAMGLALNPKLLILDEPTQGLSDEEILQFCRLVKDINKQAAILLIEHNLQVVMALAQRITVMDQGKILAEGNPAEIQGNPDVQATYLGKQCSG